MSNSGVIPNVDDRNPLRGTGGLHPTRSIPESDAPASVEDCDTVGEDVRPIRRTGRFWLPDVVENPRRTDGSTVVFSSPETKIAPAQSVPIIYIWCNSCRRI